MAKPGRVKEKASLARELWAYMRTRKKWWLGPILFILLLMAALIIFAETSAIAPFIYTLF